jgi:hypothetical protein
MNEAISFVMEGQYTIGMSGSRNDGGFCVSLIQVRASTTEVSLDPKTNYAACHTFFAYLS